MHGGGQQVVNYNRRAVLKHAAFPPKIRNPSPSYEKCRREKVSHELRREVLQKNSHRCYCCEMKNGEKGKHLELHHIVPVSFGGKTEEGNLLPLCNGCHKSVHNMIDRLHINPAKFKRLMLEDVVLQIAELRHSEKARQFGRVAPQSEGIIKTDGGQQFSPSQLQQIGLIFFTLSFALSKKQYRLLKKELSQRAWKQSSTAVQAIPENGDSCK